MQSNDYQVVNRSLWSINDRTPSLALFLALADLLHYGKAAAQINVAQSS
jgi:hypothetical protein